MTYMGGVGLASQTGLNGRLSSSYNVLIVVGAQWRGCVVHLGGVSWDYMACAG